MANLKLTSKLPLILSRRMKIYLLRSVRRIWLKK